MNCYPEALEVIEAAKERFSGSLAPNEEAVAGLEDVCAIMDDIATEFDAEFVDIEIDELSGLLSLSIEIPDMIIRDKESCFYDFVERAVWFELAKLRGDKFRFRAFFGNLWVEI